MKRSASRAMGKDRVNRHGGQQNDRHFGRSPIARLAKGERNRDRDGENERPEWKDGHTPSAEDDPAGHGGNRQRPVGEQPQPGDARGWTADGI